jgi:hypothetical protein
MMIGRWSGSSFDNELHHKKLSLEAGKRGIEFGPNGVSCSRQLGHAHCVDGLDSHSHLVRTVALYRRWWLGGCSTNAAFNNDAVSRGCATSDATSEPV